jgi:sorting nexin-29
VSPLQIKIPSKRDDCSNYKGISLLNSGYKIYGKIITQRLKTTSEAILLEEQNGFRRGRSCIDNVLTLKQTLEKSREFNLINKLNE